MSKEQYYKIRISDKYSLVPLKTVYKDDISTLFINGKGLYICNYPDQLWYDHHNFERKKNYSIEKKSMFFQMMNSGSTLLSPTQDSAIEMPTKFIKNKNVIHLGSNFTGRIAQFHLLLKMISYVARNRKQFDYILVYNFSFPEMAIAFILRYIFRKPVIVDFEDDNILITKNKFYKHYFNFIKHVPSCIICINQQMVHYFPKKRTFVFNGFIDLTYTNSCDFSIKDGSKFLYAGALDEIRGVDLIPQIIYVLRSMIKDFTIFITGSGPLEQDIKDWSFKEIRFFGFLNSIEYNKILRESDIYLVLQKPDHPFSLGSFPSKVELYSKFKKPIYKLVLNDFKNHR